MAVRSTVTEVDEGASRNTANGPGADRALLAGLGEGGAARRRAIETLYARYARRFLRYFTAHRLHDSEAQDLVQEVFVKAIRACGEFRGEARVDTWLWAIARNSLMSHYRKRRPEAVPLDEEDLDLIVDAQPELHVPPAGGGSQADACVAEGLKRFRAAFPEPGQVLALLVIDEWSIEQIAHFLGRTPGATREYLSQCRKKLRPYIVHCLELLSE